MSIHDWDRRLAGRPLAGRQPVLAALSLAGMLLALLVPVATADWDYLAQGGRLLLQSGPAAVYAQRPDVQVGPVALLMAGLIEAVAGNRAGQVVPAGIGLAYGPVLGLASWAVGDRDEAPVPPMRLAAAGALGVLPWTALAGSGHLDELLALVLLMLAVAASGRGRWLVAGVSLGLAGAAKPWGITGAGGVLATGTGGRVRSRRVGQVLVVAGLVSVAVWLPFLAGIRTALEAGFPVAYAVDPGSIWDPWRSDDGVLASWIRVPQLLLALLAGLWARSYGPTVALLLAMVVRICLDPGQWPYQFAAPMVLAVLLDSHRALRGGLLHQAVRATGLGLLLLAAMVLGALAGLLGTAVLVVLAWVVLREATHHEVGPGRVTRGRAGP